MVHAVQTALSQTWPKTFFILYLLEVSNPAPITAVMASNISFFCLMISWSIMVRYSNPKLSHHVNPRIENIVTWRTVERTHLLMYRTHPGLSLGAHHWLGELSSRSLHGLHHVTTWLLFYRRVGRRLVALLFHWRIGRRLVALLFHWRIGGSRLVARG